MRLSRIGRMLPMGKPGIYPKEQTKAEKDSSAATNGENREQGAQRMSLGECAEQQNDCDQLERKRDGKAEGDKRLGQTTRDRAQSRGLLAGQGTEERDRGRKYEKEKRDPSEQHTPEKTFPLDRVCLCVHENPCEYTPCLENPSLMATCRVTTDTRLLARRGFQGHPAQK